jgi:hypothetical protein
MDLHNVLNATQSTGLGLDFWIGDANKINKRRKNGKSVKGIGSYGSFWLW